MHRDQISHSEDTIVPPHSDVHPAHCLADLGIFNNNSSVAILAVPLDLYIFGLISTDRSVHIWKFEDERPRRASLD